jgi:L-lactate dehydrogenase complex protein LldG
MSGGRTAILSRVRAAQRTAILGVRASDLDPCTNVAAEGLQPDVLQADHPSKDQDLTPVFAEELRALGVEVHHADTPEVAREAVRACTAGLRVLAWDAEALPYGSFGVFTTPISGSSPREEQAAAEIGVTGCDAAVAETGSLVLLSGPGRSRTVSLLPPVHLAIVRRGDVVETLAGALSQLGERLRTSASCTLITGPSRTADIELTLTLGIHGPGRVIVVIGP